MELKQQIGQRILRLIGIILLCVMTTPLHASIQKERIFPEYTGLKTEMTTSITEINSYPNEYSGTLKISPDKDIYILGMNHGWYRIRVGNQEGWVSKDTLKINETKFIPYSKVLGEEIVEYGKMFIGTPYVWGGNDLKNGVDCSGLTKQIFEGFDINISRLSYTQVNDGIEIDKSELRPGDLVFFDTNGINTGKISHVGIYAGNNLFLHADSTNGVMLSSLSNEYYKRNYVTSSRILNNL